MQIPVCCHSKLQSFTVAPTILSTAPAPTVNTHGASFDNDDLFGPEFHADKETETPFRYAANAQNERREKNQFLPKQ
ncbi:unnamed protein product [Linum tenue]|uniref:Uncharacterized protein n=1 Tax=Linum tenue TaxID=586396 RepID=A0AAV0JVS0_9ROSI|nr:unnamed protein product [Linum tenue]